MKFLFKFLPLQAPRSRAFECMVCESYTRTPITCPTPVCLGNLCSTRCQRIHAMKCPDPARRSGGMIPLSSPRQAVSLFSRMEQILSEWLSLYRRMARALAAGAGTLIQLVPSRLPRFLPLVPSQRSRSAQICSVCGAFARVPFPNCNYCGISPSYHHGRCCFESPAGRRYSCLLYTSPSPRDS